MSTKIILKDGITFQNSLESGNFEWILEPYTSATIVHFIETECTATVEFTLAESSTLNYHPIILGDSPCMLTVSTILYHSAQLSIVGAYALTDNQQCSVTTRQEHCGPLSKSLLVINGIAADDASMSYQGAICIQKDATKSTAMQENKTMLIGQRAKALSIPSLEVHTNDVQCAHGSAVGPLQKEHLIYAQSRGLSRENAQRLLITSFFGQTLEGMLDKNLRETIVAQLAAKVMKE